MPTAVFDRLDADFDAMSASTAGSDAIERWCTDPDLASPSLHDLVARIWAAPVVEADRRLAALARLAPDDVVAARTLLQALRPGLRTLGVRLGFGRPDDAIFETVIAAAWERIRTYPTTRPERIAANVLLDVRKAICAERRRATADAERQVPADEVEPSAWGISPSAEDTAHDDGPVSLAVARSTLERAVRARTITAAGADIVWRTRVLDQPHADVADDIGVEPATLLRRRQRVERKLAAAC